MICFNIGRTIAIAAVVAAALLPRIAAAQTAPDSDTSVVEDAPPDVVVAPVPDVAAQAALPAQPMPEYAASRFYLRRLEFVRSGWTNLEYGFLDIARQQRLGALNPTVARATATRYPGPVNRLANVLVELTPPAQLVHIHQLHLAANDEFRAAMDAAEQWLVSNDPGVYRDSLTHFALFDELIGQALFELS